MRLKLENKTSYDTALFEQTITPLFRGFLKQYPFLEPECKVWLTFMQDPGELWEERNRFYGGKPPVASLNLDGILLVPTEKTDTLRILVRVWPEAAASASYMMEEMAKGPGAKVDSEERDSKVFNYMELVEQVFHEFSHLCSYDCLMRKTQWADPLLPTLNYDVHLHDEFLAVYRSMTAMLHVLSPYFTTRLFRGLYLYYHDEFEEHAKVSERDALGALALYRANEERVFGTQEKAGTPPYLLRKTIEDVIGRPLECQECFSVSDEELCEYVYCLSENKQEILPRLDYLRNKEASYGGAHLSGMVRAFHAFAEEKIGIPFRNKAALPEGELPLENVMDIPFYTYLTSDLRYVLEKEMLMLFPAVTF